MNNLIKSYPLGNSKDLTGIQINRLTVLEYLGAIVSVSPSRRTPQIKRYYACVCTCGKKIISPYSLLRSKKTKSCGCIKKEVTIDRNYKHGYSVRKGKHPLYGTWMNMKNRCENPNYEYKDYYKNISVSSEWRDSFETFLKDMGEKPKGYTLDRIDNTKGYSKENCRWASWYTQANNSRKNKIVTFKGESKTVAVWARELNLNYNKLLSRLTKGWTVEDAFTIPYEDKTIEFKGERKTITEWARHLKIAPTTLRNRLSKGWDIEDALSSTVDPIRSANAYKKFGRELK